MWYRVYASWSHKREGEEVYYLVRAEDEKEARKKTMEKLEHYRNPRWEIDVVIPFADDLDDIICVKYSRLEDPLGISIS